MFPAKEGECACGCGVKLTGKQKKWASRECNDNAYRGFSIVKGNNGSIRAQVLERDGGFCVSCGVHDENWQADHIIPVFMGGGACDLDNFQTLCEDCHKERTAHQASQRSLISSHAAERAAISRF